MAQEINDTTVRPVELTKHIAWRSINQATYKYEQSMIVMESLGN